MSLLKDNSIGENEIFQSADYPFMTDELEKIKNELSFLPGYFKVEIIISYLKNHSIKNDWIKANPELTKLITSGALNTKHTESVFRGCIQHKIFLNDFENYIRMQVHG